MVAATRTIPSTASGASLPYNNALDWQDKVHYEIAALWRFIACELTTVGGTANAITASVDTAVVSNAAAYQTGQKYTFTAAITNTAGVTLNINAVGVTDLLDADGDALVAGDIVAGRRYLIERVSTAFRVISSAALGNQSAATAPDYYVRDEKSNGTAGGGATAGSMQTRTLNTVSRNNLPGASLASNEFTLPAGSYWIVWSAPVYEVNAHVSRLYNVTDAAVVDVAQSNVGGAAVDAMSFSVGASFVTITSAKAFRIEHRVETTRATDGWGQSVGLHGPEIYTSVKIYKHGSLAPAVTSVPGGAITLKMTFSTTTAMTDPSSGYLRLNAATQNTATQMAIDDLDFSAVDISAIVATFDDSSSTMRGHLRISKFDDDAKWLLFTVSAVIDDTGFTLINLAPVASSAASPLAEGNVVNVKFSRTGDAGQVGFKFSFNSATSGDPGSGKWLVNNGIFANATAFHISETDGDGNNLAGFLAAIDNSTSANKCLVLITKSNAFFAFYVTAALTDAGTYDTFPITPISIGGVFNLNDVCNIAFFPIGDKGDTGAAGSNGSNGADGKDPGVLLTWSTNTADSDPGGPGGIKANNASLASATTLYVDKTGRGGSDIETFLLSLDDSTNTVKGTLILTQVSDDTQATFNITAVTDATGYVKITVDTHAGATSFTNAAAISFQFSRAGDGGSGSNIVSTGSAYAQIDSDNNTANAAFEVRKDSATPGAGTLVFSVDESGLINTLGQIKFPATQNPSADANTLDDYEEGTWTPAVTFATPGDLSVTYATQLGIYTKIGRMVICDFAITTATFTHSTAAGNLTITGLPFTVIAGQFARGSMSFQNVTKAGYTQFTVAPVSSSTTLVFLAAGSGVAQATIVAADTTSGVALSISGSFIYMIA